MNLKTIAKLAGVSTATVSYVINGNFHKVSQETIDKIQKIIEETNYKPNATARSLASKKSKIIGVVVSNIDDGDNFASNPHYAHLMALLENEIRSHGYYMMMRCVSHCRDIIPMFSSWNVDGMIFFGTLAGDVQDMKENIKVPAVFIDAYMENMQFANVGVDDYKGGYLSAKYLLEKGHREIAVVGIGFQYYGVMGQRFRGFCRACEEYGVHIMQDHVFIDKTDYPSGIEIGKRIAGSHIPFTAVAAMADIAAIGVMEGLRLGGKRVPEEISVIGFDNLREGQYTYPRLTTVSQNISEKAHQVAKLLLEMIREETTVKNVILEDLEVVERDSVVDIRM